MPANWANEPRSIHQANHVLSRALDDDLVVYDPVTDQVSHLDAVAHVVWQHLAGTPTFAELIDALIAIFDVDTDVISRDVAALLDGLIEKQLIELQNATPTSQ